MRINQKPEYLLLKSLVLDADEVYSAYRLLQCVNIYQKILFESKQKI